MKYELIKEMLMKKDIIGVKIVVADGNEFLISNIDVLEEREGSLIINEDNEEIILSSEDIVEMIPIKKEPSPQVLSFTRQGQRNRH